MDAILKEDENGKSYLEYVEKPETIAKLDYQKITVKIDHVATLNSEEKGVGINNIAMGILHNPVVNSEQKGELYEQLIMLVRESLTKDEDYDLIHSMANFTEVINNSELDENSTIRLYNELFDIIKNDIKVAAQAIHEQDDVNLDLDEDYIKSRALSFLVRYNADSIIANELKKEYLDKAVLYAQKLDSFAEIKTDFYYAFYRAGYEERAEKIIADADHAIETSEYYIEKVNAVIDQGELQKAEQMLDEMKSSHDKAVALCNIASGYYHQDNQGQFISTAKKTLAEIKNIAQDESLYPLVNLTYEILETHIDQEPRIELIRECVKLTPLFHEHIDRYRDLADMVEVIHELESDEKELYLDVCHSFLDLTEKHSDQSWTLNSLIMLSPLLSEIALLNRVLEIISQLPAENEQDNKDFVIQEVMNHIQEQAEENPEVLKQTKDQLIQAILSLEDEQRVKDLIEEVKNEG